MGSNGPISPTSENAVKETQTAAQKGWIGSDAARRAAESDVH
jgi:hypothetical protein